MSMMVSFVLSFFPRDVLDEILNLIESVSEDFPSYSYLMKKCLKTYRQELISITVSGGKSDKFGCPASAWNSKSHSDKQLLARGTMLWTLVNVSRRFMLEA